MAAFAVTSFEVASTQQVFLGKQDLCFSVVAIFFREYLKSDFEFQIDL